MKEGCILFDSNLYDILNKAKLWRQKKISGSGEQRGDEWGGGGSTGHFYSSGTILYDTDGHMLYVSQNAQNVGNREP